MFNSPKIGLRCSLVQAWRQTFIPGRRKPEHAAVRSVGNQSQDNMVRVDSSKSEQSRLVLATRKVWPRAASWERWDPPRSSSSELHRQTLPRTPGKWRIRPYLTNPARSDYLCQTLRNRNFLPNRCCCLATTLGASSGGACVASINNSLRGAFQASQRLAIHSEILPR